MTHLSRCLLCLSLFISHAPMSHSSIGYSKDELRHFADLEKQSRLSSTQSEAMKAKTEAAQPFKETIIKEAKATQNRVNAEHLKSVINIPEPTQNPHAAPKPMMVFVSLTMPDSTLRALLMQSEQFQVPLVIRGVLPEGFPATARRIQTLLKRVDSTQNINSGFAISPEWFQRFNITEVPTFVIVKEGQCLPKQPCSGKDFDVVKGNVSISDALEQLAQGDNPDIVKNILEGIQ